MSPLDQTWSISQSVELACLLEASAPKPGNVHPTACFTDMHFGHFATSAVTIGPLFNIDSRTSVGRLVLSSVTATRQRVGRNTNLGTILLLAPLALAAARIEASGKSPSSVRYPVAVTQVLQEMTPADSRDVYEAIRLAQPGGLGKRESQDINSQAPDDLISAMSQVADVDAVARQYVNRFEDIFERLWPWLLEEMDATHDPLIAIVQLQLRWMSHEPDGLIARKLGLQEATAVQHLARNVLHEISVNPESRDFEIRRLDAFLREAGHHRNPGTTADLIAATLFCQLVSSHTE